MQFCRKTGEVNDLSLREKSEQGLLNQFVPQTDTGELVEYTKAFGKR